MDVFIRRHEKSYGMGEISRERKEKGQKTTVHVCMQHDGMRKCLIMVELNWRHIMLIVFHEPLFPSLTS